MKLVKKLFLTLFLLTAVTGFPQEKKDFNWTNNPQKDDIFMTWNKNTPDKEMKDDIKALGEHGVTIKYSNLKRNSKNEITGIKVEYADRKGNKGTLELNNQKPINTITFFKQGDEIGFGEPSMSDDMMTENNFFKHPSEKDFIKKFHFGNPNDNSQSFNFSFPDDKSFGESKSKIIIKKDGKKPLVIENGKVIEGGEDYTPEEIEEIKKNNKIEFNDRDEIPDFEFSPENHGFENLSEQMKKMQEQIDKLMKDGQNKEEEKPESEDKKENKDNIKKEPEKNKMTDLKIQKT